MSALVGFPIELIRLICIEMESQDLFNFRLLSREMNRVSFPYFLDRYFRTRYHMLSRISLENLLQVSSHPIFGPSLRSLEVCIDHRR